MHKINRIKLYLNVLRYFVVVSASEVHGELLVYFFWWSSGSCMGFLTAHQNVEGAEFCSLGLVLDRARLADENLRDSRKVGARSGGANVSWVEAGEANPISLRIFPPRFRLHG